MSFGGSCLVPANGRCYRGDGGMPRFESRSGRLLELEIEDTVLTQVEGTVDGAHVGKPSTRAFPTADEARYAAARLMARRRKRDGYQLVGQARHLGGGQGGIPRQLQLPPVSVLAVEACLTAADPQ